MSDDNSFKVIALYNTFYYCFGVLYRADRSVYLSRDYFHMSFLDDEFYKLKETIILHSMFQYKRSDEQVSVC